MATPLTPQQADALLKLLLDKPGRLKIITSEIRPDLRIDAKDPRSLARPDVDLRDPASMVLQDVVKIESHPVRTTHLVASSEDGTSVESYGGPLALLIRLLEHNYYDANNPASSYSMTLAAAAAMYEALAEAQFVAITRVNLVTLATATQAGWTCAIPAGVQDGDFLVAVIVKNSNVVPTTPAGKTYTLLDPVDTSGGSVIFMWCYGHVLSAADAGTNHVWSWTSIRSGATALILRGAHSVLDVTNPPTAATTNATTVACPASTVNTSGAWVLWASGAAATATHSFPATVNSNTVTREVGSATGAVGLGRAEYAATGATATCTVTMSVTGRTLGKTLVVRTPPPAVTFAASLTTASALGQVAGLSSSVSTTLEALTASADVLSPVAAPTGGAVFACEVASANATSPVANLGTSTAVPAALTFDGSSDYAEAANHADLNLGSTFTIEFWARATSPGSFKYLIAKTDGSNNGYAVYTAGESRLRFYYGRGAGLHISPSLDVSPWDGGWHHIACVRDGADARIYIDGIAAAGDSFGGSEVGTDTGVLRIGSYVDGTLNFPGDLDEIRFWNVAKAPHEIGTYKDIEATGSETGLVACWHLNEGSGSSAIDSAGTAQNLTLSGPAWLTTDLWNPAGSTNNPYAITTHNVLHTAPDHAELDLTDTWTIEFWARAYQQADFRYIVTKAVGVGITQATNYGIYTGAGGRIRGTYGYAVGDANHFTGSAPSDSSFWDGTWHHFACVRDVTVLSVYIDGVLAAQDTSTPTGYVNNAGALSVGSWHDGTLGFLGALDEIRLWNVARTITQLTDYMNVQADGTETGLVACWHLDEGVGATALSDTATAHDLTLNNIAWYVDRLEPLTLPVSGGGATMSAGLITANAIEPAASLIAGASLDAGIATVNVVSLAANLNGAAVLTSQLITANAIGLAPAATGGVVLSSQLITASAISLPASTASGTVFASSVMLVTAASLAPVITSGALLGGSRVTANAIAIGVAVTGGALLGGQVVVASAVGPVCLVRLGSVLNSQLAVANAVSLVGTAVGGAFLAGVLLVGNAASPVGVLIGSAGGDGLFSAAALPANAASLVSMERGGAVFASSLAAAVGVALVVSGAGGARLSGQPSLASAVIHASNITSSYILTSNLLVASSVMPAASMIGGGGLVADVMLASCIMTAAAITAIAPVTSHVYYFGNYVLARRF